MVKSVSKRIMQSIATNEKYSTDELEQMEYALVTILFESVKIISLIITFSLFGYFNEVIIITGIMCAVKPFIGGYHEDTQIRCFLSSVAITFAILAISLNSSLNIVSSAVISIICLICIWYRAPVLNPRMPMTKKELIMKNKIIGTSITAVFAVIALIFIKYNIYSDCITWTITFQTLLLFNKLK